MTYKPDWYDTHCPTCDAPDPTHTPTCAVVHVGVQEPEYTNRSTK